MSPPPVTYPNFYNYRQRAVAERLKMDTPSLAVTATTDSPPLGVLLNAARSPCVLDAVNETRLEIEVDSEIIDMKEQAAILALRKVDAQKPR